MRRSAEGETRDGTMTYPLPNAAYPHQKQMGSPIMKKVWVPRFAVMAK